MSRPKPPLVALLFLPIAAPLAFILITGTSVNWAVVGAVAGLFAIFLAPIVFFARRAAKRGRPYLGTYARPRRLMFLWGLPWDGSNAYDLPQPEADKLQREAQQEADGPSESRHHMPHPQG
ncbi:MAG TPA: hypothetical protein VG815_11970 [Chloroflexota bacterium]|nr:hypothetical protein [Chloroflexota bacterium]